jgi:hypothetical protein
MNDDKTNLFVPGFSNDEEFQSLDQDEDDNVQHLDHNNMNKQGSP